MTFSSEIINTLSRSDYADIEEVIDTSLNKYINAKVSRFEIYTEIKTIFSKYSDLVEINSKNIDAFEYLEEIQSCITGYCDLACMYRFYDDPTDKEEFVKYVRGEFWKN